MSHFSGTAKLTEWEDVWAAAHGLMRGSGLGERPGLQS